jgi:putative transcriptional regulator
MKKFICYLPVFRKQHNLTQNDVAKLLNISRKTISNIENGNNTDLLTAYLLCEIFKCQIHDIFKLKK